MQLAEAIARESIRDTLARYNLAGDRGRLDDMLDCFTDDGVLEIEGEPACNGRDEIRAWLAGASADPSATSHIPLLRHHLTTSGIEFEGDEAARAWSYFFVVTEAGPDHSGRYVDRLRRSSTRWLLSHRRVVVDWMSESSRFTVVDRPGR